MRSGKRVKISLSEVAESERNVVLEAVKERISELAG
jgi:hypothetical protein